MKFAQPQLLSWLFLLPILVLWAFWDERRRRVRLSKFVAEPLWAAVVPGFSPGARLRKILAWIAATAFVILALARPQWGTHEETSKVSGLDVMVVLDVSASMEAEDVVPNRLRKAKHALHSMIDRLQGDRFGVVAFAASGFLASPLTTDSNYVLEMLDSLSPRSVPVQGTDIGIGLQAALSALERGGEEGNRESQQVSQAIVLVSDGEDHEGTATEIAKFLKDKGVQLYVLGVGTEKGAPVPVRDEMGQLRGYKKNRSGAPVVTKFHPDDLMQIASKAGGKYWNVTDSESEIEELVKEIGGLSRGEGSERKYVVYQERFQIPLAVALALLMLELMIPASKRRKDAGLMFFAAFALMTQSGCSSKFQSYFDNQKALEALKDNRMDEARKLFGQAQAKNPSAPQLNFNQGDMQALSEDAASADKSFEGAAQGAGSQENWELASKSRFNQGVERAKKKDMEGAVMAYLQAIDAAKRAKNSVLEADARKNLELLVEQQKQQKQEQKQDQQKQDQQQSSQDQKKDSDQKDKQDQKQQQQQQQKKKFEDPSQSRQRFKSQKFEPEDAERVMSELRNKEREVQKRLRQQNGKPQPSGEDW